MGIDLPDRARKVIEDAIRAYWTASTRGGDAGDHEEYSSADAYLDYMRDRVQPKGRRSIDGFSELREMFSVLEEGGCTPEESGAMRMAVALLDAVTLR